MVPGPCGPVCCGICADLQWGLPVVPADRGRAHLEGHPSVRHDRVRLPGSSHRSLLDHLPRHEEQAVPERRTWTAARPGPHYWKVKTTRDHRYIVSIVEKMISIDKLNYHLDKLYRKKNQCKNIKECLGYCIALFEKNSQAISLYVIEVLLQKKSTVTIKNKVTPPLQRNGCFVHNRKSPSIGQLGYLLFLYLQLT